MDNKITTLNTLKKGQKAKVKKLNVAGKLLSKLLDMGFVDDVEIEVIRRAPFSDPIELKLLNYHLTLRQSEAALIEVEV